MEEVKIETREIENRVSQNIEKRTTRIDKEVGEARIINEARAKASKKRNDERFRSVEIQYLGQETKVAKVKQKSEDLMSLALAITAQMNKDRNETNTTITELKDSTAKAKMDFIEKMKQIRAGLSEFRVEVAESQQVMRNQTDAAMTAIEDATLKSLDEIRNVAHRDRDRITALENNVSRMQAGLVPMFTVATFMKECPAGWATLDGHEIPEGEEDSVLYFESGNYPDLKGRFTMMKDDSTELMQKLSDSTAVNGLNLGWGGLHNQHHYQRRGIHEGSSLADLATFYAVLESTYRTGNHGHVIYGDPVTRPLTFVVNKCIKVT